MAKSIAVRLGGVINVDDYSNIRVDVEIIDDVRPDENTEAAVDRVRLEASEQVGKTLLKILAQETTTDSKVMRKMRQHPLVKMAIADLASSLDHEY